MGAAVSGRICVKRMHGVFPPDGETGVAMGGEKGRPEKLERFSEAGMQKPGI